jgi:hypothetical protein
MNTESFVDYVFCKINYEMEKAITHNAWYTGDDFARGYDIGIIRGIMIVFVDIICRDNSFSSHFDEWLELNDLIDSYFDILKKEKN